jgi:hypothetical protein
LYLQGFLEPQECDAAFEVYGDGARPPAAAHRTAKQVDYKTFIELVIPDVEKQIAQQLFSLGVNMVSVMEHINDRRVIAARAVSSGIADDTVRARTKHHCLTTTWIIT